MIIGLEVPKNRNKTHLKENDAEMVHIIDLQFIKISCSSHQATQALATLVTIKRAELHGNENGCG